MFKFTRRLAILLLGVPLISICLFTGATVRAEEASTWNQVAAKWECPEWFKDAKFGLWLHWGPQTIPAKGGGWYARSMYMEIKPESWGKEAWSYHRETYGYRHPFQ
jgi:alpha-L-fucosidase